MSSFEILLSLIAAVLAASISAVLVRATRPLLLRVALAKPNARSSHRIPTPRVFRHRSKLSELPQPRRSSLHRDPKYRRPDQSGPLQGQARHTHLRRPGWVRAPLQNWTREKRNSERENATARYFLYADHPMRPKMSYIYIKYIYIYMVDSGSNHLYIYEKTMHTVTQHKKI